MSYLRSHAAVTIMLAIFRLLCAVAAVFIGWGLATGAVLAGTWYLWQTVAAEPFMARYVALPPAFDTILLPVLALPAGLVAVSAVAFVLMSPSWLFHILVPPKQASPLVKNHPYSQDFEALCRHVGLSRAPSLMVYDNPALNAFSISTLSGSLVAFSVGLGTALSAREMRWVLAHELCHIRAHHALSGAFWAATETLVEAAWNVHSAVVNAMVRVSRSVYSGAPFVLILLAPVVILSYFVIGADYAARFVFRCLDRLVGGWMERRADAQASRIAGYAAGISALELLGDGLDPRFALFARTPVTKARLRRLQALACEHGDTPQFRGVREATAA